MKIGRNGLTNVNVLSMDEVEDRWKANPLDTTYPHIPWWRRRRDCQCLPEQYHRGDCTESPVYASLTAEADGPPWMGDLPSIGQPLWPHLWYICGNCGTKLGEVNKDAHLSECPEPDYDSDRMDWRW